MKKHIPNVLTVLRAILFAPLLIWLTLTQQWNLGMVCFSIGIITNNLDGYLARRWNVCSKLGAETLQPVCDMVFATTAVVLLIATGHWSFWIGVLLFAIAGILQLISNLAKKMPTRRLIRELKRHQSYIHPLYSGAVMYVAWFAYFFVEDGQSDGIGAWYYTATAFLALWSLGLNYKHGLQMMKSSLVRV